MRKKLAAAKFTLILVVCTVLGACSPALDAPATPTLLPPAATLAPTAEPTAMPPTEEPTVEPDLIAFQILADRSEARFYIDELLFGEPKTVVGRTSDLAGELQLDWAFPALAQIGPIQINARDLTTDSSFRNRALRRQILDSAQDEFQFIIFEPSGLDGVPEQISMGEPVSFVLTGDLTIREITQPVSFEMTVTPVSETELNGSGVATVMRADFELEIPKVTGVAEVSEGVRLEFDFVAVAVSS